MAEETSKTSDNRPQRDEKGRLLPGNTANPNGRPKGISITELVRQELEKVPEGENKITYAQAFVKKVLHKAIIEGDTIMIKAIWNYIDGMPKQGIEVTGEITKKIISIDE